MAGDPRRRKIKSKGDHAKNGVEDSSPTQAKIVRVTFLPSMSRRHEICSMRTRPNTEAPGHVITLQDHLWVHNRTRERAYAIWVLSGCPSGTALRDWLQAEDEVLIEFCRRHSRSSDCGRVSGRARKQFAVGTASLFSQKERTSQSPQGKEL
jgi:Protein of unknown function (DUF2934)